MHSFLKHHPDLQVVATHINTLVAPPEPAIELGSGPKPPSVIIITP